MGEDDSRNLRIEFHKADALRELRPYLDVGDGKDFARGPSGPAFKRAAIHYLSRVVYAHLESLLESYPIASDIDIEAFTDSAIQDAQELVKSQALTEIAVLARVYLVDAARATYLGALAVRKTGYASSSALAAFDDFRDYETWSSAACEGFLTKFHATALEASSSVQLRTSRRPVADAPAATNGKDAQHHSIEQLKHERSEALAAYKADTGVFSDRAIYNCAGRPGMHSCHKPQFLQWKNGLLPPECQPCISLENFLKERRLPPARRSED
jgi:hypothetical protein